MTGPGRRLALFAPMGLLIAAFVLSVAGLLWSSATRGGIGLYVELLSDPGILRVLWRTVWIAVATTAACALLGYPLALFLARSPRRNLWLLLVISPWLVSIVVRTFGWVVLLGNRGVVNTALRDWGLIDAPVRVLFTPWAVLIGLVHVFLPFMVIAILSSLLLQDRRLEEAGRILGGTRWQTFRRVTLPLSLPGVVGGSSLVLLMSAGAIVTPLLLGGLRDRMLGTQIYTEVFQVFNFERATAMAVILLVVALVLVAPLRLLEARVRRRLEGA
ncbi:ABC transporter permease [Pararoseomonas indoligenes]|uniref:ABC transporter permease n=1 Tax=Roseomonas indoligenes TaxID=2820811 RepID=A0A940SAG7_9PROT|nr:ABC transporter permease [Pararoseomonas indoligenes]MBP0496348.1 ABC transporter permease [Pararoseomonas indoligenes]